VREGVGLVLSAAQVERHMAGANASTARAQMIEVSICMNPGEDTGNERVDLFKACPRSDGNERIN